MLAAAAAVVAVAVVGDGVLDTRDPDPLEGSSAASPSESTASDDAATPQTPAASRAVPVYYVGDAGQGPRLYREFRSVDEPDDGPGASLDLLTTTPLDPDYRTLWPAGAFAGGSVEGDRITVELGDGSLVRRPAGMGDDEASLAVQQAVYTLQAYAQQRLPVEFTVGGERYRLDAYVEKGDTNLFVMFRDRTSADETYPAGRFMYVAPPDAEGRVVIDFNRAYNPPCAFSPFATCPLPPRQNVLPFCLNYWEKR